MRSALIITIVLLFAIPAHACVVEEGWAGTVSIDCQGSDVVKLYTRLAEAGGVNIVIHPALKGEVTIKLDTVRWDKAIAVIAELMGHIVKAYDNTIFISPLE